jgi:hypothetical protein
MPHSCAIAVSLLPQFTLLSTVKKMSATTYDSYTIFACYLSAMLIYACYPLLASVVAM